MALPFLILSTAARQPVLAGGASGYRTGSAHRAVSAGLAIAIAGSVGAALILALVVPSMEARVPGILLGGNIEVPPPTVEQEVEPAPRQQTQPLTIPRPQILIPPTVDYADIMEAEIDPFPPTGGTSGGSGLGGGGVVERVPDPLPPVWRTASRDPRFADRFQPDYPTAMEREGVEGRCPVSVTIAASGRVTAVRDNGCATAEFFRATERQALRHWRFRAATRDGVAVESTQEVAVTFRIEE